MFFILYNIFYTYVHTHICSSVCCCLVAKLCLTRDPMDYIARQASQSMGFPRQVSWSGLPVPFQGDLLNPGIKAESLAWQVGSLPLSHLGTPVLSVHIYFV